MQNVLRLTAMLATVSLMPTIAIANDPTIPGAKATPGVSPRVQVNTGPSPVARMSSASEVTTLTCTTTPTRALRKGINMAALGDVAVHFTGEFFPGCRYLLRLTRNGVVVPGPGDGGAPMAAHDTAGELSTNGFNWMVQGVPAGIQVFEVQCECTSGTGTLDERSLIIYHR